MARFPSLPLLHPPMMMTVSSFLSSFLSIFLSVDPLFPLSPIFLLIEFISTCLYFRIHIFLFHLLCLFLFLIQIVTARPPFGRSVLPSRWRRWGNPISMDWREFYRMIKFSIPSLFFFLSISRNVLSFIIFFFFSHYLPS